MPLSSLEFSPLRFVLFEHGHLALHEAGMARMGSDPKKSVLNQFQRTHDINNLYVMDASGFTSNPCQNPTLTIMSLCVRSCDFLMQELKKGA